MVLLLELAGNSLSQFQSVQEDMQASPMWCTWRNHIKATVMKTAVQKQPSSKGIASTLYDLRKADDRAINWEKLTY